MCHFYAFLPCTFPLRLSSREKYKSAAMCNSNVSKPASASKKEHKTSRDRNCVQDCKFEAEVLLSDEMKFCQHVPVRVPIENCMAAVMLMAGERGCSIWREFWSSKFSSKASCKPFLSRDKCLAIAPKPTDFCYQPANWQDSKYSSIPVPLQPDQITLFVSSSGADRDATPSQGSLYYADQASTKNSLQMTTQQRPVIFSMQY